jgi:hypothetical protein
MVGDSMESNVKKPCFLITIDTEGDNLWGKPSSIITKNAEYLYRFQKLCEEYSFKPTYLTNYEMASDQVFIEFARDVIKRDTGEIGMHLHPWNSPPLIPLTMDDFSTQPYLIEYNEQIIRQKIEYMTKLLEDTFQVDIVSHRAGRWAINEYYAKALQEFGYKVDCSVTPLINWSSQMGNPCGRGGTNYSSFPDKAYFLNLVNVSQEGKSNILEVPMTVIPTDSTFSKKINYECKNTKLVKRLVNRLFPSFCMLRPNGKNLYSLLKIIDKVIDNKKDYAEFMIHSSELMPGGSPTFKINRDIEKLYRDLRILFDRVQESFNGATMAEYYNYFNTK